MLLGLSLSVSWICLLLFSSTACFPATKGDYRYPYTVTWGSSGGSAPALQPASSPAEVQSSSSVVGASSHSYEPVRYAAAPSPSNSDGSPGLPWVVQPAGGADGSFYDFSNWMPSQPFPDFRVGSSVSASASNNEMPQSVSEVFPPSYIIQSRNGYMRGREVMSNTRYSPEFPEPPPFPVGAPSKSGPVTRPAGGVKA